MGSILAGTSIIRQANGRSTSVVATGGTLKRFSFLFLSFQSIEKVKKNPDWGVHGGAVLRLQIVIWPLGATRRRVECQPMDLPGGTGTSGLVDSDWNTGS